MARVIEPSTRRRTATGPPAVAAKQAGAFTRHQAYAEGWSEDQVQRRVRTGRWVRVAGRGLVSADADVTPATRIWAVHLTWPDAVASHSTAASLYRMPVPAGRTEHAITPRAMKRLSDLRPHRVRLDPCDTTTLGRGGPALTTPERTVLDCLRTSSADDAERLLAWALTRGVVSRDLVREAAVDGYERWGTPVLREVLRRTRAGALSEAERLMHAVLRSGGITGWRANAPVHDATGRRIAVVDVLFERRRLVLEVDGWAAHGSKDAFQNDRTRQNRLVAAGWTVLRFTWADLAERPDQVLAVVRAALA